MANGADGAEGVDALDGTIAKVRSGGNFHLEGFPDMRLEFFLEHRGQVCDALHAVRRALHVQVGGSFPGNEAHHASSVLHVVGGEGKLRELRIVDMDQEKHFKQRFFHILVKGGEGEPKSGLVEVFKKFQPFFKPFSEHFGAVRGQGDTLRQQARQAFATRLACLPGRGPRRVLLRGIFL